MGPNVGSEIPDRFPEKTQASQCPGHAWWPGHEPASELGQVLGGIRTGGRPRSSLIISLRFLIEDDLVLPFRWLS